MYFFFLEDIPLCLKYSDKIKLCTYVLQHYNIFIILTATSFGHHQAISLKLEKAGTYGANFFNISVNGISYVLTILHYMYQLF